MIKVLIVDDEVLVRIGIKSLIDWEENGFLLVGEAQNGEDALEKIKEHSPHILVTDIKMPRMDGIQLLKELDKTGQRIHTVILSCHNEFEYVREAMKYGARDYVLKLSMQPQELLEVLNRVKKDIEKHRKNLNLQGRNIDDNANDIKEKFLKELISGSILNMKDVLKSISNQKLKLDLREVLLISMKIDCFRKVVEQNSEVNTAKLLKLSLANVLTEILASEECEFLIGEEGDTLLFVSNKDEAGTIMLCKQIKEALLRYINISVSFGVSKPCSNAENITEGYHQSKLALEKRFFLGSGSITIYDRLDKYNEKINIYTYDREKELFEALCRGKCDFAKSFVASFLHDLLACGCSPARALEMIREVLNTFSRGAKYFGGTINSLSKNNMSINQTIGTLENIEQIKEWFFSFIDDFKEYVSSLKASKYRSEISEIMEYISINYKKEIDLNSASAYVNMSAAHFCTVFKKETGKNFTEYLTALRLEKAKELILKTDMKIYELAEAVGYSNANYFSKLFRKYTGVSPEEYKRHR
jgi:two-component system, response regulator YesN